MTTEQRARLEALQAKAAADLSEIEKTELGLLVTIEKQATQITEKDSMLGTKGTEIGELKKKLESATGDEKEILTKQLEDKQDALDTLKIGLDALKEANVITKDAAGKISQVVPGHGGAVDPKEVEALETKAFANEDAKAEVEAIYKDMDDEDKKAYRSDPAFKKMILEKALGTEGEETDDTPWATGVKKVEGKPAESAEDRMKRLFDQNQKNHRRVPQGSSGRGGRGRRSHPAMPKAVEREEDTRSH